MIDSKYYHGDFVGGIFFTDHESYGKNVRFFSWLDKRGIDIEFFEGKKNYEDWGTDHKGRIYNARIGIIGREPIPGKIFIDMGVTDETFNKVRKRLKKMVREVREK